MPLDPPKPTRSRRSRRQTEPVPDLAPPNLDILPNAQFDFTPAPNPERSTSTSTATPNRPAPARIDVPAPTQLTGLGNISHGLNFPVFDANQYFASDLFTDSAPLQRTTKQEADRLVGSIGEKRQTLRVAMENIAYNQDVVKAATSYRKLEGMAIDYASVLVNNQTKYLNYQTAGVNQQLANVKLQTAQEKLTQEGKVLTGVRSMSDLIDQEWEARRNVKLSRIADLKQLVLSANAEMEKQVNQLSSDFNADLNALPG